MPKITITAKKKIREALLEAAWRVFAIKGMEGLTMRAVAVEADCAVGGIYTYFPDKESLILELGADSLLELGRNISNLLSEISSVDEATRNAAKAIRNIYGFDRPAAPLLPVLLNPEGIGSKEFQRKLTGRFITAFAPIAEIRNKRADSSADIGAETLAIASFLLVLVLLESSGQTKRLEISSEKILEAFINGY